MATEIAELRCPRCRDQLRPDPAPEGLRWRCARGHGLAATLPVVSGRGDADPVRKAWVTAKPPSRQGKTCPSCSTPMSLTSLAGETVDVCRRCHLLWFDDGEYASTAPPPSNPKETRPLEVRLALARAELAVLDARKRAEDEAPGVPDESWKVAVGVAGLPFDRGEEEGPTPGTWLVLLVLAPFVYLSAVEQSGLWSIALALVSTEYLAFLFGRIVEWRLGHARLLLLAGVAAGLQLIAGWLVNASFLQDPYAAEAVVAALGTCALVLDPGRRYGFWDGGVRRDPATGSPYTWWNVPGWILFTLWLLLQMFALSFQRLGPVGVATLIGVAVGVVAGIMRPQRRDA